MNSRVINILLPIVSIIIYICVDLIYIFLAKSRYEPVIVNIQKEPMEIDIVAGCFCYAILALGWYFMCVQLALSYYDKLKQRSPGWTPIASSALSGLVAGALYGLTVYGVYNLTTRALFFSRYPLSILFRDIAWGTLFNIVFTSLYMIIWRKLTSPVQL